MTLLKNTPLFLIFCIFISYLPFLNLRTLRMAGDEKVYISQAIEMVRDGRWFVQTLANEPNYFKGPLHYLFLHLGILLFGNYLIAATWMNLAMALGAAISMFFLGRKYWGEKSGLLLGLATGLNVGIFSHALVSQMEVELCAFYAFAITVLGLTPEFDEIKNKHLKFDFLFWLIAGVVGWVKSPVYSVLIGGSGILFWLLTGQLKQRFFSFKCWLALLIGILVCLVGYAPAFIIDRKNFIDFFIVRENLAKPDLGHSWDYVVRPLLYFSLPWTLIILFGLVIWFYAKIRKLNSSQIKMIRLGFAFTFPTILFWCLWKYKGQNYNLPVMSGLLTFGWACFEGDILRMRRMFQGVGLLGILVGSLMFVVILHFWPLPEWWSKGWLFLFFVSVFIFSFIFIFSQNARVLSLGVVTFFIAFGALVVPLGEREMMDIRHFKETHPGMTYHYDDLEHNIWSEWGILQLTLHEPFYVVHEPSQLREALKPGHVLIVQHADTLRTLLEQSPQLQVTPWIRWLTKGRDEKGQRHWEAAWQMHDLSQLERTFSIVWSH